MEEGKGERYLATGRQYGNALLGVRHQEEEEYVVPRRLFSDLKMRDFEWPLNVIQGVLCRLWRQMRPRLRVDKVAVCSVVDLL